MYMEYVYMLFAEKIHIKKNYVMAKPCSIHDNQLITH